VLKKVLATTCLGRDSEKFLVNMLLGEEAMESLFLCSECLGWKGGDEKFLMTTVGLHG
jgi:hypothetical protein